MTATLAPRTVLEAFLPAEGEVPLDRVYDTANTAGIEDQRLRLAIRRMIAAGEVHQQGRGREGALSLTRTGRERLDRDRLGLRLAFAQDQGLAPWDRRWRLLAVSLPESERAVRDTIRRRLTENGAAAVGTSLYLSPHDLLPILPPDSRRNLVLATSTDLSLHGQTDPLLITEQLWPAAPITEGYTAAARTAAGGTGSVLLRQLRLADALEQALRADPLIPPELRPDPWPPAELRREWHRAWLALAAELPDPVLYRGWLDT